MLARSRSVTALGLTLLMAFPALGLAAPAPPADAAPPGDVAGWLARAASGELPTDCDASHAVPLVLETPEPAPLPAGQADTVNPVDACPGLRPGARLSNGCTMNFVFTDGASLYIGTAGHCTSSVGQRMSAPVAGAFGTVVYRLNGGIGSDFALIRVDADKVAQVNPRMCTWGGPTGATAAGGPGNVLLHYGWGFTTSATPVTRMRVQVAAAWDGNTAQFWGWGSPGDSGSPLIDQDGEAYAILTHGAFPFGSPVLWGTAVPRAISLAKAAGYDVQVVPGDFLV